MQIRSSLLATVLMTLAFVAPTSLQAKDKDAPTVPEEIEVPEGNIVHFHGYAEGFQIYTWNGVSWGSSVPEAVLFDDKGRIVAIHYAGPTWESKTGSKVIGAVAAPRVTVDPDSIPWLLLRAVDSEGPGILDHTSFIQRVNTVGGNPPSTPGVYVGQVARIPYAADYFFYRQTKR